MKLIRESASMAMPRTAAQNLSFISISESRMRTLYREKGRRTGPLLLLGFSVRNYC